MKRAPADAFALFVALGTARTFELVATSYGLTPEFVVEVANRELWLDRAAELERRAEELAGPAHTRSTREADARHRRILQAVATKAITALRDFPLQNARDGIRAAELVVRLEQSLGAPDMGNAPDRGPADQRALVSALAGLELGRGGRPRKRAGRKSP